MMIAKKFVDTHKYKELGLINFLKEIGLLDVLISFNFYYSSLVEEFY